MAGVGVELNEEFSRHAVDQIKGIQMYFSAEQIKGAIAQLNTVHPFFGITFLACKRENLPIGELTVLHLDTITKRHMEKYHKLNQSSKHYYQPFHKTGKWVRNDYPSNGLQAVNTQTFKDAFIHQPRKPLWGWSCNYIEYLDRFISRKMRGNKIPAYALAVWLYKDEDASEDTPRDLISKFMQEYNIIVDERQFFDQQTTISDGGPTEAHAAVWHDLRPFVGPPPDTSPIRGGMLGHLHIRGSGPAPELRMEPSEHMTIITGDNGLGKTFLLDCAWWALTGTWADQPAAPRFDSASRNVLISFGIRAQERMDFDAGEAFEQEVPYDWNLQEWSKTDRTAAVPGLILYVRGDGSFAIWDPIRRTEAQNGEEQQTALSGKEVWNGKEGETEGLIRDWAQWQSNPKTSPFSTFSKVLKVLSPPDLGELSPGALVRLPHELRPIPTIRHSYGEMPIVNASAGVKRVVTLAYLLVWLLEEHHIHARFTKRLPENRIVVLIDEMEAHLHPKWQRLVLPAFISVIDADLRERYNDLSAQIIISTHSPLVLASVESKFDDERDSLIHLGLKQGEPILEPVDFIKYGNVALWLTSPVFGLEDARSREAEAAILQAMELIDIKLFENQKIDRGKIEEVTAKLRIHFPDHDDFWPRWIGFARKSGVDI